MLGAITGDTIGSAYEFCNTKDYNFTLFLSESAYTDDSIMTMAVVQWPSMTGTAPSPTNPRPDAIHTVRGATARRCA